MIRNGGFGAIRENIKLTEQNKVLSTKYEKERAKVFQLNYEVERINKQKVKKVSSINKPNMKSKKKLMKLRAPPQLSDIANVRKTNLSQKSLLWFSKYVCFLLT